MPNATEAVNANPRSARKKHSINESMGRFAMVRRQIATNEMPREPNLSNLSKLLIFWLLTSERCNSIGYFCVPVSEIVFNLGVSAKAARKALRDIEEIAHSIKYDPMGSYVLIPSYLRWNAPETPSHKQLVINDIATLNSGHPFYSEVLKTLWDMQGALPAQAFEEVQKRVKEQEIKTGSSLRSQTAGQKQSSFVSEEDIPVPNEKPIIASARAQLAIDDDCI